MEQMFQRQAKNLYALVRPCISTTMFWENTPRRVQTIEKSKRMFVMSGMACRSASASTLLGRDALTLMGSVVSTAATGATAEACFFQSSQQSGDLSDHFRAGCMGSKLMVAIGSLLVPGNDRQARRNRHMVMVKRFHPELPSSACFHFRRFLCALKRWFLISLWAISGE
jgi:hypothetical protein